MTLDEIIDKAAEKDFFAVPLPRNGSHQFAPDTFIDRLYSLGSPNDSKTSTAFGALDAAQEFATRLSENDRSPDVMHDWGVFTHIRQVIHLLKNR